MHICLRIYSDIVPEAYWQKEEAPIGSFFLSSYDLALRFIRSNSPDGDSGQEWTDTVPSSRIGRPGPTAYTADTSYAGIPDQTSRDASAAGCLTGGTARKYSPAAARNAAGVCSRDR